MKGLEAGEFTKKQALGEEPAEALIAWLTNRMLATPLPQNRPTPAHLPETTSSTGRVRTYDRFSDAISPLEWSDMLWEAEREIILAAPKLRKIHDGEWYDDPRTSSTRRQQVELTDILTAKLTQEKVDVSIILPQYELFTAADVKRTQSNIDDRKLNLLLETMKKDAEQARFEWLSFRKSYEQIGRQLQAQDPGAEAGQLRVRVLTQLRFPYRLTMTDRRMLLTLRLHTERFNSRFCIDATPSGDFVPDQAPVFALVRQEVEFVLNEEASRSDKLYEAWLKAS